MLYDGGRVFLFANIIENTQHTRFKIEILQRYGLCGIENQAGKPEGFLCPIVFRSVQHQIKDFHILGPGDQKRKYRIRLRFPIVGTPGVYELHKIPFSCLPARPVRIPDDLFLDSLHSKGERFVIRGKSQRFSLDCPGYVPACGADHMNPICARFRRYGVAAAVTTS